MFFLFFIIGVFSFDGNLDKSTNLFIKHRLIPALKNANINNVNFTRLRLCHCSTEIGCNVRTTGWVPSIMKDKPDRDYYKNVCYTDGSCFQNARPHPELSHYGCIDSHSVTDENDFHDSAVQTCSNTTSGYHTSYWVCCDNANFCANETSIYVEPLPANNSIWILVIVGVILLFAVIVWNMFYNNRKTPEFGDCFEWYLRFKAYLNRTPRNPENNSNVKLNGGASSVNHVYGHEHTMSTLADTGPSHLPRSENDYPEGIHPDALNMLMALEETSGSGIGPTTLHAVTIGRQITLGNKIGSGRFGNVSLGDYRGEAVAVKIFKCLDETAFHKEVQIFETRMLRHPQVLRFIGSDRIDKGYTVELWLITEYHPSGSLHDFLEENVINMETFYSLMRSAASGLAFLHNPIGGHNESSKPEMAHRDVKSRNIMVKSDLTCAIGDLGLSLSKPTEESIASVVGNSYKCGTVRYLAPEILSSTLQADVFDSFKMADVYSFALVMWETLCRCEDGNVSAKDPEMVIPYIEWTERDPTDEQMLDVVCTRKLRPTEGPCWNENEEFQSIMEIVETCWSANPTARYSTYQCMQRLGIRQLEMREKNKKLAAAASGLFRKQRRKLGPQQRDIEMTPMGGIAFRATAKVHDTGVIDNRNGHCRVNGDRDPLL